MDAFARGLLIAADIRRDGVFERMLRERYASWDGGLGAEIEQGKHSLVSLESYILKRGDAGPNTSGRQELLENILNRYI
jgi:xylose isomerase